MKTLILILIFVSTAFSQVPNCPTGYVCLTQEAAQKARDLAIEAQKVPVLEEALKEKDKTIKDIQDTAQKNEADLKAAINKTNAELAEKTGQLIAKEAEIVRLSAWFDIAMKNSRKKCMPFSVCF